MNQRQITVRAAVNGREYSRSTLLDAASVAHANVDIVAVERARLFHELVDEALKQDGILTSLLLLSFTDERPPQGHPCPYRTGPIEEAPK